MPISSYLRDIRSKVGTDLLLLPSVTGMVWNKDRELLLVQETDGWNLPGGIIEPEEYPAQALIREIREESGVVVRATKIVGVFGGPEGFHRIYPNGDQVKFIDVLFECMAVGGELNCGDGEALAAKYFSVAELAALNITYPISLTLLTQLSELPIFHWNEDWLEET
jgi:8-oxo-dGTP pyrophosphatase MutT (NUDIX family)